MVAECQSAPEGSLPPQATTSPATAKKRKTTHAEIEVNLAAPEPPSKKARRALKRGKVPAASKSTDEDAAAISATVDDGGAQPADGRAHRKESRSGHGVWIGNLPWDATKVSLRKWLVDNAGGSITDESITRVHMPTTKAEGKLVKAGNTGGDDKTKSNVVNKGFAYVDFVDAATVIAALALSETAFGSRNLLIKDQKSFEGRPQKDLAATSASGNHEGKGKGAGQTTAANTETRKIFVGNLPFDTTEDELWAHFEKCGDIHWVKVATFQDTGKCKGYAWVNFGEPAAAAHAVKGFVKIKEKPETAADILGIAEEAEEAGAGDAAGDEADSSKSDGPKDGEAGAEKEKKKKKNAAALPPQRVKTRKWWVNKFKGRALKLELAEDDQVRYKKRFGKDAKKSGKGKASDAVLVSESAEVEGRDTEGAPATASEDVSEPVAKAKAPAPVTVKKSRALDIAYRSGGIAQPKGVAMVFD